MKKTKKLMCLLLVAMILTAVSCADSGDGGQSADTTTATNEVVDTETTAEVNPIEDEDFGGAEFKVLSISREGVTPDEFYIEAETGDVLEDAIYTRNRLTEEKLNVKFLQAIEGVERNKMKNTVSNAIMSGEKIFDIALINLNGLNSVMALKGSMVNLDDISTLDLDAEWWDQNSLDSFSVTTGGIEKHYVVGGALNLNTSRAVYGLVFNEMIINDLGLDSPYTLVKDGTWTFDKMYQMMEQAKFDVNGDTVYDENDRWGLVATQQSLKYLVLGAGEELVIKGSDKLPVINSGERIHNVVAAALPISVEKFMPESNSQFFAEDKALFMQGGLSSLISLRAMETDFGVVPSPKLDEAHDRYYCPLASSLATVTMVPAVNDNLEMTGTVLNALGYYSLKTTMPVFYDVVLENKAVRNEQSLEMVQLMNSSKIYVFNDIFNFGDANNIFINVTKANSNIFASTLESFRGAIEKDITKFLDSIS